MSGRINSLNNGYVGSSAEIPTCSVALGIVTPRKQYINALEIDQWNRPNYWIPLPAVSRSEQKIVGLFGVFKGASGATGASADSNWVAFTCRGAYVVDWGITTPARPNGFTQAFADNTRAQFQYNYNDLPDSTTTPLGYRQAIITITPQAGQNLTTALFNQMPTGLSFSAVQFPEWLEFRLSVPNMTALAFASLNHLKQVEFIGPTNISYAFAAGTAPFLGCLGLERIIGTEWTTNLTDGIRMFSNCLSLRTLPLLDTRKMTTQYAMFNECYSLHTFPCINTSKLTSFSYFMLNAYALVELPFLNTSSATAMNAFLAGSRSLESIPPLDCSKVTNFGVEYGMFQSSGIKKLPFINTSSGTNFSNMFNGCNRLKEIPLLNTSKGENFNAFIANSGIITLPPIDTSKGRSFYQFAFQNGVLKNLPGLCFAGVTGHPRDILGNGAGAFTYFLGNCNSLVQIPDWDFSHIAHGPTSASGIGATGPFSMMFGDFSSYFSSAVRVMGIKGIQRSINLTSQTLSPTQLNNIFTNLRGVTVYGGSTINITNVWGATTSSAFGPTADRTIATNKGWTVIG